MYPFMIDLKNKKIVIVGGGKVAANRVLALLPFQPFMTVISPTLDERLEDLYEEKKIQYEKRKFQPKDVENAFIVIAATNDYETNQLVKKSCHENQLYNIVDDPKSSSFHFPAMHQHNGITVAVTTSGISPMLAKQLRDEFAEIVDALDDKYLTFLQDVRNLVKTKPLEASKKKEIYKKCLQKQFVQSENERQAFFASIEKL